MRVALIDNGSLEPAAQLNLRAVAAALSAKAGIKVSPISWRHSDRIPVSVLGGEPAWTLENWVRTQLAAGEREFVFVPFFISPQGAIGSALHDELRKLQRAAAATGGFHFTFSEGIAQRGAVPAIVAERVRETIFQAKLHRPPVLIVDHGGPSAASAALRNSLAREAHELLGTEVGPTAAVSMEGAHGPLLADQLAIAEFAHGDVVVALLFFSPGRHAGLEGDVAQICGAAEKRSANLRCHLTGLVGTHPATVETLALALRETLTTFQIPSVV
jgi:sirohydrochlorin ferrochelatase